jgi:Cu(I)/Ag(I) efflux system membrane protein CusA/SilA
MFETVVDLKPPSEWPKGMTKDRIIEDLTAKLQIPGVTNAWTMPIKGRIDMLSTGVRTPVGIKVFGSDLKEIENIGSRLEGILKNVDGTRSVYGERTSGGYFVDFDLNREAMARYGLSVADVNETIMTAIGGENVSTTIEGRERYPINVRYPRELRDDVDKLARTLVSSMNGAQIPLGQVASIRLAEGPSMIRDEDGKLSGYVYVDVDTAKRDIGSYVAAAKKAVDAELRLQPGYLLQWSGQYEAMARVRERMKVVLPLTLFIVFGLIYMNTKSLPKTAIVLLAVPFSAIGAVWFLYALGYNVSIGVWVGLIALLGLDAETGIFMLLYLDLSHDERRAAGKLRTVEDLDEAIFHGAVHRVRPKVMTVACAFFGLVPIMWSTGAGADVMKRIAAPMIGGLFTSFLMELLVYPAIYKLWRQREVEPMRKAVVGLRWAVAGAAIIVGAGLFAGPRLRREAPSLFPAYESVRQALVEQSLDRARSGAVALQKQALEAKRGDVASSAKALASASTLESARTAFGNISEAMIAYRRDMKADRPAVAYCSMVKHSWLQAEGPISNPYVGREMATCGELRR